MALTPPAHQHAPDTPEPNEENPGPTRPHDVPEKHTGAEKKGYIPPSLHTRQTPREEEEENQKRERVTRTAGGHPPTPTRKEPRSQRATRKGVPCPQARDMQGGPPQAIETPTVPPREDASTPTTRTRTPPWGNPGDEDREILASLHVTVLDTWARRPPPILPSLGAVLGPGLGAGGVGCQSCHWWRGQGSD